MGATARNRPTPGPGVVLKGCGGDRTKSSYSRPRGCTSWGGGPWPVQCSRRGDPGPRSVPRAHVGRARVAWIRPFSQRFGANEKGPGPAHAKWATPRRVDPRDGADRERGQLSRGHGGSGRGPIPPSSCLVSLGAAGAGATAPEVGVSGLETASRREEQGGS